MASMTEARKAPSSCPMRGGGRGRLQLVREVREAVAQGQHRRRDLVARGGERVGRGA